jgi:tetratricopeptide (TPR) repeat protein
MPDTEKKTVLVLGTSSPAWNPIKKLMSTKFPSLALEKLTADDTLPAKAKRVLPLAIIILRNDFESANISVALQRIRVAPETANTPIFFVLSEAVDASTLAIACEYEILGVISPSSVEEALPRFLNQVLQKRPDSDKLHELVERVNRSAAKNAIADCDVAAAQLYAQFPHETVAQIAFANACIRNGEWFKAKDVVSVAFQADPKNPRVANTKIRILLKERKYNDARALLNEIEVLSPQNATRIAFIGDIHAAMGNKEQAKECYKNSLEIVENNRDARISLAQLDISQGLLDEALQVLREAATQDEMGSFFNDMGVLAVHEGRFDDAHSLYDSALKVLHRKNLRARIIFNVGLAHYKSDKVADALKAFEHSQSEDPDFERGRETIQWIQSHLPQYSEITTMQEEGLSSFTHAEVKSALKTEVTTTKIDDNKKPSSPQSHGNIISLSDKK